MRILTAIILAILVLGGTGLYIRFAESIKPEPIDISEEPASGDYSIDVTLTFDVESNMFSGFDEFGLRVKMADKILLDSNAPVPAGKPIRIERVDGIKVGRNEVWVYASPSEAKATAAADPFSGFEAEGADQSKSSYKVIDRAIRVRIFRDDEQVAEKTLWSANNEAVSGTIELIVDGNSGGDNDSNEEDSHSEDEYGDD